MRAHDSVLAWRLNRLRCMTRAEIRHRLLKAAGTLAERWGVLGSEAVPPPDLADAPRPWIHTTARVDAARYLTAADRVTAGRFDVFALRDLELGSPPRWNRDPKTGIEAPLSYGKQLNYRDPSRVGDIRYLWELNRHQHIVTLAQAHALRPEPRYFSAIRTHLESWFESCPRGRGPNWSSALEAAIRLINWAVAWQLLEGAASPVFRAAAGGRFRRRWLESVFQHAQFIRGHFSLYSSANNHLIGEAAGLFIAALAWPCWAHARSWLGEAREILEREIQLQNASDGVNREQAVSYQQFELDLLLFALFAGRANGEAFSPAFESRIEAMLEYLASIMDAGGNVPMFGDSDDGCPVRLNQGSGFCRYRSLLATGALLFRRGDFKAKAGELDDKTRWLFGEGADRAYRELETAGAKLPVRTAFLEGGYYILGSDFETPSEIRLVVDAGPLGYEAIAAHGHADALAFTLSIGGVEFLVDPGTYAFDARGPWRGYFRGTSSHNTVRVDGEDQSEPGGSFMWLRKASASCTVWRSTSERDVFQGSHDGYARLPDPVTHRRGISLDKGARRVVIEDAVLTSGTHEIELFFHCSEACGVEAVPGGYRIRRDAKALMLRLPQTQDASARAHRGELAPICGWVSRRFGERRPAWTIAWRARVRGDAVLRSEIDC
jgi:hypothetical protein